MEEIDMDTAMAGMAEEQRALAVEDEPMLTWFAFGHLSPGLAQQTSVRFCLLATGIATTLPRCPERTVALRKLLEAKDAAVRAGLPGAP